MKCFVVCLLVASVVAADTTKSAKVEKSPKKRGLVGDGSLGYGNLGYSSLGYGYPTTYSGGHHSGIHNGYSSGLVLDHLNSGLSSGIHNVYSGSVGGLGLGHIGSPVALEGLGDYHLHRHPTGEHVTGVTVHREVQIPVSVPHPVPVEVTRTVPVPHPVPVHVDHPYPVPVPHPVPVEVTRNVPVAVDRPYPVPVPTPVEVRVPQPIPVPVSVPHAVPVPVTVPQAVPVVVKNAIHSGLDLGYSSGLESSLGSHGSPLTYSSGYYGSHGSPLVYSSGSYGPHGAPLKSVYSHGSYGLPLASGYSSLYANKW